MYIVKDIIADIKEKTVDLVQIHKKNDDKMVKENIGVGTSKKAKERKTKEKLEK